MQQWRVTTTKTHETRVAYLSGSVGGPILTRKIEIYFLSVLILIFLLGKSGHPGISRELTLSLGKVS